MSSWALVADPDPQRAQLHRHLLASEGMKVFVVRDGDQARSMVIERGAPAMTLTDLSLARFDGFGLIKLIRSRAPRSAAKIIALSGVAALRTEAQKLQGMLGLSGVLASWAPVDTVKRTVRKALSEDAPPLHAPGEAPDSSEQTILDLKPEDLITDEPPGAVTERERLLAVEELAPKDGQPASEELQQIVEKVAARFGVSSSFISIIQKDKQWLRAHTGMKGRFTDEAGIARDDSFCTNVMQGHAPMVVPDAAVHPYFSQNPLVQEGLLRSYAGAPVVTASGAVLGALCIVDTKPMSISQTDLDELVQVARQVAGELEISRTRREQAAGRAMPFTSSAGAKTQPAATHGVWFDAVLENISQGVMLLDQLRRVIVVNRAYESLLGVKAADLIGKARDEVVEVLAPRLSDPESMRQQAKVAASGPYALRLELNMVSGKTLSFVSRPVPLQTGTGQLIVVSEVEVTVNAEDAAIASPAMPEPPKASWRIEPIRRA